jgi:hypothetical protein
MASIKAIARRPRLRRTRWSNSNPNGGLIFRGTPLPRMNLVNAFLKWVAIVLRSIKPCPT